MGLYASRSLGRAAGWRRVGEDPREIGRRVLARRWLGLGVGRRLVIARDIDIEAGVAAVVWRGREPRSHEPMQHIGLYERIDQRWRWIGGGSGSESLDGTAPRRSAARFGPAAVMVRGGGSAVRSLADRQARQGPDGFDQVGWVACLLVHVAVEVDHLVAGARRISVRGHGRVVVVWRSPPAWQPCARPRIAAMGRNGSLLTELGPTDYVDSATWASLDNPPDA